MTAKRKLILDDVPPAQQSLHAPARAQTSVRRSLLNQLLLVRAGAQFDLRPQAHPRNDNGHDDVILKPKKCN